MSVSESEFVWVDQLETVEAYVDEDADKFVLHSDTTPRAWIDCAEPMEVQR